MEPGVAPAGVARNHVPGGLVIVRPRWGGRLKWLGPVGWRAAPIAAWI